MGRRLPVERDEAIDRMECRGCTELERRIHLLVLRGGKIARRWSSGEEMLLGKIERFQKGVLNVCCGYGWGLSDHGAMEKSK